jgi:phosphoserine phosphatase
MKISAVCWDVDKVWYPGISTSYLAERSNLDPGPLLEGFLSQGWFDLADIDRWAVTRRGGAKDPIKRITDLSELLTDLHYEMRRQDSDNPVITMEQCRGGKQAILRGLTMKQIKEVSASIQYSPGLLEAVEAFKRSRLYQAAFSDGLAPLIIYHVQRLGLDYGEAAPTIVELDAEERLFENWMLERDDIKLAGKTAEFDKAKKLLTHLKEQGYPLSDVAIIDDSGINIEPLLLPIHQAGGIALGYNPTEVHKPIFRKYSIPVLKSLDLRAFAEIVADRKKISDYCE